MTPPTILTDRLRLRARTLDDVEANLAMDMDPAVQRHLSSMRGRTPEAHRAELIARIEAGWPQTGALWAVEWRNSEAMGGPAGFLGWCALFPLQESGLIEIGYRYVPAAWGRGVATEAGRAVLDHGFRVLGFDPIVGVTAPEKHGVAERPDEDRAEARRPALPLRPDAALLRAETRGLRRRSVTAASLGGRFPRQRPRGKIRTFRQYDPQEKRA